MTFAQGQRSVPLVQDRNLQWFSFALAFKPLRDMFIFSGRSRRSEVICFYILGFAANLVTLHGFDGSAAMRVFHDGWWLLWTLPWIALLVRRLHDQGRSARWALAIGAIFVVLIATAPLLPQSPHSTSWITITFLGTFHPTEPWATIYGIGVIMLGLILLWLYLAPEEAGTNRYGPDPRLDPEDIALASE